jgi:hypothetical protein
MRRNHVYWTDKDEAEIVAATTFPELGAVAMRIIKRMPSPVGQVCGPISTGGKGNIPENIAVFEQTIEQLIATGHNVFDQTPFEEHIFRIIASGTSGRHQDQLLREFYLPIFESGLVRTFYFIKGWESSRGATWEHEQATACGYDIIYLP